MKHLPKILCLCLLSAFSVTATETKNYNLALSKPGQPVEVEVEIHRGSITVEGYEGDSIDISASYSELSAVDQKERSNQRRRNDDDRPKRSMKGLKKVKNDVPTLQIEEDENEVEITSRSEGQNVHLTIKVPKRSALKLSLYSGGDISVTDVKGAMEIENHRGAVKAVNVSGPIVVETHKSDIEVLFSELNQNDPSFLTSHMGNIDISVPKKMKSRVEIQTYQGEIYSGLTEEFKGTTKVEKDKNGSGQEIILGGLVAADVNGGGQRLTLNTYKGDIYIRKM